MSKDTITIRRVKGAPLYSRVVEGDVDIDFDGPGPFRVTPEAWPVIQRLAPDAFEQAPPRRSTADDGGED